MDGEIWNKNYRNGGGCQMDGRDGETEELSVERLIWNMKDTNRRMENGIECQMED